MTVLYWIPLATILLAGIIRGLYASVRQAYGYSNPFLFGDPDNVSEPGLLPSVAIQAGVVMSLGMWLVAETKDNVFFITLITGLSGLLCLVQILIRSIPAPRSRNWGIVLSDGLIGSVFAILFTQILPEFYLLAALTAGLLEIAVRAMLRWYVAEDVINLFPLWLISSTVGLGFPAGAFIIALASIPLAFLLVIPSYIISYWLDLAGKVVHEFTAPFSIVTRFRKVICGSCLRYTEALAADYRLGRRFCEHCGGEVDFTCDAGKVLVLFGEVSLDSLVGRVFLLRDVQHALWEDQQIDVSEIYIDTESCDAHLLERFITHLLHTPSKHGIGSIKFFHEGSLSDLPANLRNALHNNFRQIVPFASMPQVECAQRGPKKEYVPHYKNSLNKPKQIDAKSEAQATLHDNSMAEGFITVSCIAVFLLLLIKAPQMAVSFIFSFYGKIFFGAWLVISFLSGRKKAGKSIAHPKEIISHPLKEWLVIIAILGLIAAIAIPNILTGISRSPQKRSMADMRAIGTALGSYHVDYNQFPRTGNVIRTLPELIEEDGFVGKVYYAGSIHDAWKEPYYYISDGDSYTLLSYGKDKKPGSSKKKHSQDIRYVNGELQEIVD